MMPIAWQAVSEVKLVTLFAINLFRALLGRVLETYHFPPTKPQPRPDNDPTYDSVVILALELVTLTPSAFAFATISTRFLEETADAISAAYVLLCMRRSSTSRGL